MTQDQITKYEYCDNHLKFIKQIQKELPFKVQRYGCGSQVPNIEHELESIHRKMYQEVTAAINRAKENVEHIIEEI